MILLVQPRANFHASIMPTCLHLLLFATPATLRGSWKRRCSSHFSMSSFLCQDFRSVYLWFFKNQKFQKTGYKCPKNIKKYQSSSKFNNCQSSALEQSASISNRSDRSKLQSGGTVRSQPRIGSRVASIRHVRRIPWNPLLEPRVGCIRVAPGREESEGKRKWYQQDIQKNFSLEKHVFDIICTW